MKSLLPDSKKGKWRTIMKKIGITVAISICLFLLCSAGLTLGAQDIKITPPGEHGAYIMTPNGLVRLLPNIVLDENGALFIEPINPPHFMLKDVQYFVLYGKHDVEVFTLNPMVFFQNSAVGRPRFVFGKDIDIGLKSQAQELHVVKPKGILGRGYYSLWINETAWDFILD